MADLLTINNLEGALSPMHVTRIRARVIEAGGDLQDYQDTLADELQRSNEAFGYAMPSANAQFNAQRREENGITTLDEEDDGSTEYAFDALTSAIWED